MKLALMAMMILLSGCTVAVRDHKAERAELNKLAACVCSSAGGISYLRMYERAAQVICHKAEKTYHLRIGDVCYPPTEGSL